jgi:hypothetical protein
MSRVYFGKERPIRLVSGNETIQLNINGTFEYMHETKYDHKLVSGKWYQDPHVLYFTTHKEQNDYKYGNEGNNSIRYLQYEYTNKNDNLTLKLKNSFKGQFGNVIETVNAEFFNPEDKVWSVEDGTLTSEEIIDMKAGTIKPKCTNTDACVFMLGVIILIMYGIYGLLAIYYDWPYKLTF